MGENTSEKNSLRTQSAFKTNDFSKEYNSFSQKKIIKNLIVLCSGLVLLFTGYNGLSMLQSTLNQEQGIGVVSQSIIYAGFCVSALLLPKYTIKKLGCKRTLLLSMTFYIPYIAANFYFNWLTVVPSAIMVGLAASLLWSSQCTYFNESSTLYCVLEIKKNHGQDKYLKTNNMKVNLHLKRNDEADIPAAEKQGEIMKLDILNPKDLQNDANDDLNSSNAICLNNGSLNNFVEDCKNTKILNVSECTLSTIASTNSCHDLEKENVNKMSQISDSEEYPKLVSSVTARFFGLFGLLFRTSDIWSNLVSYYVLHDNNVLDNITESGNCSCGASFCNVESNCFEHNLAEPSREMRNILTGVSLILSVLGVLLIFLFLDDLETDKQPVKFSFNLAMATCRFIRRKEALLLIPLSSYIGFQQGFYIGDFTKSYIACAWGVYHVGLVTICYGVASGISATLAGFLVKYVGRISIMLLGAAANAALIIFLLMWNPLPDQSIQFFASAAIWGISVGILWSQLRAFYGVIFKKDVEAAFAGFYLWDSIGYCAAFSYSNYLCTYIKIYILIAVSTLGMIGYLKTEQIHIKKNKELKPN